MDKDPSTNQKIPRFLIYDIVKFETETIGQQNFDIRMQCIEDEIIIPRKDAMRFGKINRNLEPFSVRKKDFFPIKDTHKLLSADFTKQLSHGIDGLIYQPVDEVFSLNIFFGINRIY